MKAAVYHGPNKVEIADVPEPEVRPGTVKLKVGFNGICGTDLHEYYAGPIFVPTAPHPLTGQQLPLTIGHEFSGVITEVGSGVDGWTEGDRVAVEPIYKCGQCPSCRAGNYNVCAQIGFHGLMSDGGMAEYTDVGGLPRRHPRRGERWRHRDGVRRGTDRYRTVVRIARQRG
jgi:(R,R)-butanediol dehydrogenase/meso-butanediol dehydrogenase/diacetyl reductase